MAPDWLLTRIVRVIEEPSKFYAEVAGEHGLLEPLKYAATLSIPFAISVAVYLNYVLSSIPMGAYLNILWAAGYMPYAAGISLYILLIAGQLIGAGIVHALVRVAGGKGGYSQTYKAVVYSSTPTCVFGWIVVLLSIPFGQAFYYASIVFSLFGLYIEVIGLSLMHGISRKRAAACLACALVVMFLASFVAAFMLMINFVSFGSPPTP
jgi:hypothetical protein